MLRKIITALILVPLAVVFVTLAVANRQMIVVSLDPFDQGAPALAVAMPLFGLTIGLLITGVIIGGVAAWLRQSKWRRAARVAEGEARTLRAEVDRLKRRVGPTELASETLPRNFTPQLTIRSPAA